MGLKRRLAVILERLGDGFALADRLVDLLVKILEDGVSGRFLGDVQGFENGHAAGDEGAEGAGGSGDDVFFDELAEDGHFEDEEIPADTARRKLAHQLDHQPDRRRHARQKIPVVVDDVRGGDQHDGHDGQFSVEVVEDLDERRHDLNHDEDEDADGEEDDGDGIDQGALDLASQGLGSFLELGEAAKNDFERAAGLAGLDHVDIEPVEGLGRLAHGLGER